MLIISLSSAGIDAVIWMPHTSSKILRRKQAHFTPSSTSHEKQPLFTVDSLSTTVSKQLRRTATEASRWATHCLHSLERLLKKKKKNGHKW